MVFCEYACARLIEVNGIGTCHVLYQDKEYNHPQKTTSWFAEKYKKYNHTPEHTPRGSLLV